MAKANGPHDLKLQSLANVGYQQGKAESRIVEITKFAMSKIATLGDLDSPRDEQMTKEQRDELKQGHMTYFNESIRPPRYFRVTEDKVLVEMQDGKEFDAYTGEKRKLDVHIAFAVTQQALNDLKSNDVAWYQLLQELKTDFNAYASNRIGDLIRKAKEIRRAQLGVKRERIQALAFEKYIEKTLDDMLTRARNAESRGNDPSVDVQRLKRQIAAFKAVQ